MSDTDTFINEVTEELKRDRLFALWRRYGAYVIGGIVLIVAGTAAMSWMAHQRTEAARDAGAALLQAAQAGDPAAQATAFEDLALKTKDGPALVARFALAAAPASEGDAETAAGTLDFESYTNGRNISRVMLVWSDSNTISATNTRTKEGGARMTKVRASRSHLTCMKNATMRPAFNIMKIRINDHLK